MEFNFNLVMQSLPLLMAGAGITIKITALSVTVGILIGLFMGIARICRLRIFRLIAAVYVDFFRGTPLLVQIFLVYFALPLLTGQRSDPYVAAISACGLNSGAYVAEIFRSGIQSIDRGQMEAGRSLGMTWGRRCVISSCRRRSRGSFHSWEMSLSPCSRIPRWYLSSASRS